MLLLEGGQSYAQSLEIVTCLRADVSKLCLIKQIGDSLESVKYVKLIFKDIVALKVCLRSP